MRGAGPAWPRVIACLPAYNAEKFVASTLETLAAQDYPNLEIFISDDASTDDTARVCQEFVSSSRNRRLIRQPRRLGWVDNVNALLAEARGDYLMIMPQDDLIHPTYVTRMVQALEANPRAVLAFSNLKVTFLDGGGPGEGPFVAEYKELDGITSKLERAKRATRYLLSITVWPHTLVMAYRGVFRAGAARRIGGMRKNPAGEVGADWAWLLRLALLGEFVRIPEVLAEKCFRKSSLSTAWKYTLADRFGAWVGCVVAVRRARLPLMDEIKVQWWLADNGRRYFLKTVGPRLKASMLRMRRIFSP